MGYLLKRVGTLLKIVEELDLIGRHSVLAKVYGIDLESTFTRGSQYRVEGILSRVAAQ